jgi:hypothetical protein
MNEPKAKTEKKPLSVYGSDAAPVVFFDGAFAWGVNNGVVQIEVATNQMVPAEAGPDAKIKIKTVVAAHLRCSLSAAQDLRNALDAALKSVFPDKKPN